MCNRTLEQTDRDLAKFDATFFILLSGSTESIIRTYQLQLIMIMTIIKF